MSEQDNSPEISANSPKSPSTPEKRFSLSKLIENIVLFIAGAAFTISLFSKNKNTETKESHKDNQKEIKESHEKAGQSQEVKNKEIKSPLSKSRITNRLGDLHSNASRKICLKLRKKITKDKLKDMLKKLGIAMGASSMVFIASWITTGHWRDILNGVYPIFKYLFSDNIPLGISISLAIIVAFSMLFGKGIVTCSQKGISSLTNRYFMFTLATLAILGASSALLVPSYTNLFREPGYTSAQQDSAKEPPEKVQNTPAPTPSSTGNKAAEVEQKSTSDLRLHLLYITGGIIAILGLIETNRKNSQDHIRQVHAARRERYIEAVDKLSSDNAPVRLGGVYALVGLVDEWLDDDNIDEKIRTKEGQVIINNLCAYVRSPFPLAEKIDGYETHKKIEDRKEKESKNELSEYESERFKTILEYLTNPNDYKEPKDITTDYAKFHEEQDVRRTIFDEIHNRSSKIFKNERGKVVKTTPGLWSDFEFDFSRAPIFYSLNDLKIEKGNFSNAKLYADASFTGSDFVSDANFSNATFSNNAYFNKVAFSKATFISRAEFNHVKFTWADFDNVTFAGHAEFDAVEFTQHASFSKATFDNPVRFRYLAEFIGNVNFSEAVFTSEVDFTRATFIQEVDFSKATFAQKVNFNGVIFKKYEPTFVQGNSRAQFSVHSAHEDYNFSLHSNSKPIPPGEAELDGVKRQIPAGTVLFDPDSDRISEPAKPIDKFDNQGEAPSK